MNELSSSHRAGLRLLRLGGLVLLSLLVIDLLHAQISEEAKKKRDAFLKAREEMRTIASPTPAASASPGAKPKPAKPKGRKPTTPKPEPSKSPVPLKSQDENEEEEEEEGVAEKKSGAVKPPPRGPEPTKTPAAEKSVTGKPASEDRSPAVRAVPVPAPSLSAPVPALPADITIEKSGLQKEQGFEPPPPPPPRFRFWPWSRKKASYRYLTNSVIEAIRRAPVRRGRWKFVIVHNSGTRQGNARAFDYYHRRVRRMANGMAYHFVVGNGTSSGNGQVEIGDRWRRQINGGHVHSDYLNNISLGICLVGDFNRDQPTRVQLEAAEELIRYLRERCGRMPVRPHREMNPPRWATDCPGDAFPYGWFRRF